MSLKELECEHVKYVNEEEMEEMRVVVRPCRCNGKISI